MDLDAIIGRTEASRRALIRGAVVGIAGLTGVTTARTGGEEVISYLKDDRNDDEEQTIQSAEVSGNLDEGGDGGDGEGDDGSRTKEVVSQVDLTERDGRVTLRLGA